MMFARHSVLLAALALAGCSREQDTPPEHDTGTSNASTDTSGTATLTTTTTQGTEASGTSPDTGSASSSGGEECLGENDCWNCAPTQPEQVLNHCTNADCEPFANTPERLPLLARDGSLPPIP